MANMKRSGFKRPARIPQQPAPLRPVRTVAPTVISSDVVARPKEDSVYSEPYRRLVAAMSCSACGIEGYSQAAHPPPTGKGRKEDDRTTFALCCDRPMVVGCHKQFDNYQLVPADKMRAQAAKWGADTRAEIYHAGNWPVGLPAFEGDVQ
jgi:hypothetical protein